ncbi:MAG TPA: malto-oligosyltrehalose trehalohydrolase [Rhodanobacteraceae bacterium]|nr:malto-oligosyltrehalose trehalohydrolase [Rhodanobacteraceae bacterium]
MSMAMEPPDSGNLRKEPERRHAWGTEWLAPGKTCFRLWAPDCERIWLDTAEHEPWEMTSAAKGFFELTAAVGADTAYGFRLKTPDGLLVPDPASRAQQDDVEGRSLVVDPHAHAWQCTAWRGRPWHEAVVCEVHVGLIGGFDAVRRRLDGWAELGLTAIELMPVNAFCGARNWGYDGALIYAPETSYGTPAQLKALIDAAHERGLMMLLDVVYNHFGPKGNFLPQYASGFFREDIATPWGAAIDFRRPQVRDFFIDNALYWLNEYRFDGLRLDAAHAIQPQSFLETLAARVDTDIEPGRHVHLIAEHEGNAAHLLSAGIRAQWNDDFHHAVHVMLTGEHESYYRDYQKHPVELLARTLEEGFAYQGEISTHSGKPRGEPSAHLMPTCFVDFLQNHDQIGNRALGERLQVLAPNAAVEAAMALLFMAPQVPMLFMDEEYASTRPFPYFTDYHGELATAVREGRRQEFADFSDFSSDDERARIPDPNARETFDSARLDEAGRNSKAARKRHALVQQLLQLRHREVIPWLDQASSAMCEILADRALRLCWPRPGVPMLIVVVNLGDQPIAMPSMTMRVLFESEKGVADACSQGRLPAFAALVGAMDVVESCETSP